MSAQLRPMQWPDLAAVAALDAELFGKEAWSEATWWSELAARPDRVYAVAVADGGGAERIVGYAGTHAPAHGDVADVMTIGVAPSARGQGLGARLLQHLVDTARERGAEHLMLEVRADNGPARRLYDGYGFGVVSVRRRYYQPDDVDAIIMRLPLTRGADT